MANILLVEDNLMIADCYQVWLQAAGHTLTHASSAQAAFNKLDESTFDLIILDLLLPGVNGLQFLHLLPSYVDWAEIPVIICTQNPPKGNQFTDYGVRAVLDKAQIDRNLLCVKVTQALGDETA